jgi:hypothetical protein
MNQFVAISAVTYAHASMMAATGSSAASISEPWRHIYAFTADCQNQRTRDEEIAQPGSIDWFAAKSRYTLPLVGTSIGRSETGSFDVVYAPLEITFSMFLRVLTSTSILLTRFCGTKSLFCSYMSSPTVKNAITMEINKLAIHIFPITVIFFGKPMLLDDYIFSGGLTFIRRFGGGRSSDIGSEQAAF